MEYKFTFYLINIFSLTEQRRKISEKPHKVFVRILVIGEIVRSGKGLSWNGVSRSWRLTADPKPYLISVVIPFSH